MNTADAIVDNTPWLRDALKVKCSKLCSTMEFDALNQKIKLSSNMAAELDSVA